MNFGKRVNFLIRSYILANCSVFIAASSVGGYEARAAMESQEWQAVPESGIITKPGRYYLKEDLKVDRSTGIKIEADDVAIDLCQHALRYTGTPKAGTLGIAAAGRKRITINNGIVGGFWFNVHCTENERLRINNVHFDNIPYIAINVAQSKDVVIGDNVFDNFRYDLPKEKDSTYVIGINIGADGAVIANNHFTAKVERGTGKELQMETVFVLFSAEVTKNCLVTQNQMSANEVLHRSYGVWVATNAEASIVNNSIQNVTFGVCLAGDASSLICFNRFMAGAEAGLETVGISALGAKDVVNLRNNFEGVTVPAALPKQVSGASGDGS
jgi:hypothetical protein